MKILMIHPHDLYSAMEPWTIRMIKLAEQLASKGHQVKIAYFPMTKCEESFLGAVHAIPLERIISTATLIRNIKALCALSREADLVHLQKSHFYAAIPAVLAAYWCGKPLHYDWDDWEEKIFYASLHKKTLTAVVTGISFWSMERCLPFLADSVSVASEKLKKLAMRRGVDARKISLVPVGADAALFHVGAKEAQAVRKKYNINDELLVLYQGQLHDCQYVKLFLKAAKTISDNPGARHMKFMVLGDGSQLEALKKFSKTLELRESIIFVGSVPHSDVPMYIAAADICIAPFEDNEITRCKSPLKIVEYLASGKAIVASDVGEVRNMMGDAGIIVPAGQPDRIAAGIMELAGDDARRKTMAVAARRRVEIKYNWRSSAEALEKAHEALVS
ncbi:MAG: glycosyltransferase family 4 protein [Candidatus Omnitrophota bacterium]